jgi:hypothetical protein
MLNVLVQIINLIGLQKKNKEIYSVKPVIETAM